MASTNPDVGEEMPTAWASATFSGDLTFNGSMAVGPADVNCGSKLASYSFSSAATPDGAFRRACTGSSGGFQFQHAVGEQPLPGVIHPGLVAPHWRIHSALTESPANCDVVAEGVPT